MTSATTGAALTLLGTAGGPPPFPGRSGISSALVVDGRTYLVDVGHGAFGQLHRSGIEAASVRSIFLTHLHSDHIADLFTLLWLRHGGVHRLEGPIDVHGPGPAGTLPHGSTDAVICPERPTPGTIDFLNSSIAAAAYDLNVRMRDESWPDIREVVQAHDIELPAVGAAADGELAPRMSPFPVYADDAVTVTATLVLHPPVFPAFAYRFDTAYGSVVFSGDTALTDNLIELASGADYLVHEAIDLNWIGSLDMTAELRAHLAASHTDIDEVGTVARRADVGTLVLSHLVPPSPGLVSDADWHRRARAGFDGPVVVGNDLMQLPLPSPVP